MKHKVGYNMIDLGILIAATMTLLISISLLTKKISQKIIKIAYFYNFLFFLLFLFLISYRVEFDQLFIKNDPGKKSIIVASNPNQDQNIPNDSINEKQQKPLVKANVMIDAPIVKQYPELPRGCEVTSLAMLLLHAGVQTDKMELAQKVKKDTTPYKKIDGVINYGDPNDGFIGDMYSLENRGYGVYHKPIKDLAETYLPDKILDLTGSEFNELERQLSNGVPVWIITNVTYKELPSSYFQNWQTPNGPIKITYKEHSVLITGYDPDYIYFNDPITGINNKQASKEDFIKAWIQMGRQAITYIPDS